MQVNQRRYTRRRLKLPSATIAPDKSMKVVGPNVVANGSGAIDLTGLVFQKVQAGRYVLLAGRNVAATGGEASGPGFRDQQTGELSHSTAFLCHAFAGERL